MCLMPPAPQPKRPVRGRTGRFIARGKRLSAPAGRLKSAVSRASVASSSRTSRMRFQPSAPRWRRFSALPARSSNARDRAVTSFCGTDKAVAAVLDHFQLAGKIAHHHGHTKGHGLGQGRRQAVHIPAPGHMAGRDEDVRTAVQVGHGFVRQLPWEGDELAQAKAPGKQPQAQTPGTGPPPGSGGSPPRLSAGQGRPAAGYRTLRLVMVPTASSCNGSGTLDGGMAISSSGGVRVRASRRSTMRCGSTDGSSSQTALRVASVSQRTKAACSAFTSQSLAGEAKIRRAHGKGKGIWSMRAATQATEAGA